MNRLGLGILSRPNAPPLPADRVAFFDPLDGIAESGGFVDSWTSVVGSAVLSAMLTSRPQDGGGYLQFDGIDDALTGAAIDLSGLTAATLGFWVRQSGPIATAVVAETADFPTGLLALSTAGYQDSYSGAPQVARSTAGFAPGTWTFFAQVFDGAQPVGSRTRVFSGTSPAAIANVTSFDNTVVTSLPASTGVARVGGRSTVYLLGSIGLVAVYRVPLTLDQLKALAAYRIPPP